MQNLLLNKWLQVVQFLRESSNPEHNFHHHASQRMQGSSAKKICLVCIRQLHSTVPVAWLLHLVTICLWQIILKSLDCAKMLIGNNYLLL